MPLTPAELSALDPVAHLRRVPPFDVLPEPLFLEAAAALEIGLWEPGARLVVAGREPLRHLYVIRRGAVRLERDGRVLQVLEEGEAFGYTSLLSGHAALDVVVEETLLADRLPASAFERLLAVPGFAAHFGVGLGERLAASLASARSVRFEPDVGREVGGLVRRAPVWIDAGATVGEAARVMHEARVSSALVRCAPPGIVTDRDLRGRVLAEGLGPDAPVLAVCSRPLRTLPAAAPLYEAWRIFLDAGVNHLVVVRGDDVVGVLTSTDLLRHSAQGPLAVLRRFERVATPAAAAGYARAVAEMAAGLLASGLDPARLTALVAHLDEVLLRRLLQLALADLGPAPAPWAWLARGAAARGERTLLARQEAALVFAGDGEGAQGFFEGLAARLATDLATAGFLAVPGRGPRDAVATLDGLAARIEAAARDRPYEVSAWLDLRRLAGPLATGAVEAAVARAARGRHVIRHLAAQALALAPPAPLLLRLRGAAAVDLERQALLPIVFLARCFAVEAGSAAQGTLGRLDDARAAGVLSERAHAEVSDAWRFLLGLALASELRDVAAGRAPAPRVAPAELTALERSRLKDALRVVQRWQEAAAHRWQPDLVVAAPER